MASLYWYEFDSASARASRASTRLRSSVEMPLERKAGSTFRRCASHSTVSAVGRVFPRSIWLTYSFEKRSPANSVCVRPAATRRRRRRSPSRAPEGAAEAMRWAAVISVMGALVLG